MASLKITYGFKGGALGLRSIDASSHSPPGSDPITPGAGGIWITVHDSKGEQIHAQILNDPRAGSGPNSPIPDKTFVAVTPNPGDNGFIAFHMNFGQPKVAVFPLKTSRLFRDFLAKLLRLLNRKKQRVWLLILSDGFTEAERPRFHAFADRFVDTLCESPPFKEYPQLRDAIAVRDGPTRPGGEFGWTIQGLEGRLLAQVDLALANKFIAKLGIDPINILAVINDNRYGGSGGDPAVTTVGDPANLDLSIQAAIHEVGHSAFALADEYESEGTPQASPEPIELNVAGGVVSVGAKWGPLLTPNVKLPTPKNSPADTVGMFEGAKWLKTGNFRGQITCRMRTPPSNFCAVCSSIIRGVLDCELQDLTG